MSAVSREVYALVGLAVEYIVYFATKK